MSLKGKGKQVMVQDAIDVDDDGRLPDMNNLVRIGGNNKGKDSIYGSDGNDSDDKKFPFFRKQSLSSTSAGTDGIVNGNYPNSFTKASSDTDQDDYNYSDQDDYLEYLPQKWWSGLDEISYLQAQLEKANIPAGIEAVIPRWSEPGQNNGQPFNVSGPSKSSSNQPLVGSGLNQTAHYTRSVGGTRSSDGFSYTNGAKSVPHKLGSLSDNCAAGSFLPAPTKFSGGSSGTSSAISLNEDAMKWLQQFENFAVVHDYSDHHHGNISLNMQPRKTWVKNIQDEWKILKSSLPDLIFVRAYESKMNLLRAVIIGPKGTPYHDGLFFFDVLFPSTYPDEPPHVHYHSGGLRLNPNLYDCGKVCLSLLGTWPGRSPTENWIPGKSTLLQILVSIQALILNAKPYFNEPGYTRYEESTYMEKASQKYNEETLIKSLKTMLYSMRRPPQHFEGFVSNHFISRAHDVLLACNAYMDGAQVGSISIVEGKAVRGNYQSCSDDFKVGLRMILNSLIDEFSKLGVKNCDGFRVPESKNQEELPGSRLNWMSQSQYHLYRNKAKLAKARLKTGNGPSMPAPFPQPPGFAYPFSVHPAAMNTPPFLPPPLPGPAYAIPPLPTAMNSSPRAWKPPAPVHAAPAALRPHTPYVSHIHPAGHHHHLHIHSKQKPNIAHFMEMCTDGQMANSGPGRKQ